jgi:phosphoglycolate phosphatase
MQLLRILSGAASLGGGYDGAVQTPRTVVMFDLDGTLSDPLVGIGRSINYALMSLDYEPLEQAELAIHIGPPLDHAFRSITGDQSPAAAAEFVARYRERYGEIGYSENVL